MMRIMIFRFNRGSQAYIEISRYDYLVNVDSYTIGGSGFTRGIITLDNTGIKLAVKLEPSTNLYVVQINTNESVTFELEDLIEKLNTTTNNANSIENFIMEKESPTLTIRLMLKHVSGIFEKDSNKPTISSIDAMLLLTKKRESLLKDR